MVVNCLLRVHLQDPNLADWVVMVKTLTFSATDHRCNEAEDRPPLFSLALEYPRADALHPVQVAHIRDGNCSLDSVHVASDHFVSALILTVKLKDISTVYVFIASIFQKALLRVVHCQCKSLVVPVIFVTYIYTIFHFHILSSGNLTMARMLRKGFPSQHCCSLSIFLRRECSILVRRAPLCKQKQLLDPRKIVAPLLSLSPHPTFLSTALSSSDGKSVPEQSSTRGLLQLLNNEERKLLREQRRITKTCKEIARAVGISTRDFDESVLQDNATFSVVIAGEYNAGKSTLINALLGKKLLEAGSLPTTDCITIISSSQSPQNNETNKNNQMAVQYKHYSNPILQDLTFVDTPGTNAVLANHTLRTTRLLPTADLILFVTTADRPFSASEQQLLESIAAYRKSIVLVINKMDILEQAGGNHGAAEKQRVVDFVTQHASALLGARPFVWPVSARDALNAKLSSTATTHNNYNNSSLWQRSQFAALEHFLQQTLTAETKLRSKLTTPLGIAENWLQQSLERLHQDNQELEMDVATLRMLQSQFQAWHTELESSMQRIRRELSQRIEAEGERATVLCSRQAAVTDSYRAVLKIDELWKEWHKTQPPAAHNISMSNSMEDGGENDHFRADLQHRAQEAAESISTLGRAQGQAVIEFLGQRPSSKQNTSLVGSVTAASRFEDTRNSLLHHLTQSLKRHVYSDNLESEPAAFLNNLRQTVLISVSLNLGALCLAMITALEWVPLVPGALGITASLALSASVLSMGRQRLARQYADRWALRARDVDKDLELLFNRELDRVDRRVREGVSPYTRFVEAEQERINQLTEQAEDMVAATHALRHRINHPR